MKCKPDVTAAQLAPLLQALSQHQGAGNGISAGALAARLQLSPRQLRKLVSLARAEGVAICGRPSTGYFMATTAAELQATCEFLHHRAMHSLHRLARMQKVSLPVLMGQMLLNKG